MAFSVQALQSAKPYRNVGRYERFMVPGDPGTSYTRGKKAYMDLTSGLLAEASDGDTICPFTVVESVTLPAATQAFPAGYDRNMWQYKKNNAQSVFVLVEAGVPQGTPVELMKIANYQDETVTGYAAATRSVGLTTGFAQDDRSNGALLYVYEGPGAGEMNIVEDYDHAGGTYATEIIVHRAFNATLTTASKMIILAETTADNEVSFFGRMDLKDADELDVNDGTDDGDFVMYGGWDEIRRHLANGHLPVIRSHLLF